MKSAYEKAMERFGIDPVREMSPEKKAKIAEIESLYKAKIAEAEVMGQNRIKEAGQDAERIEQVRMEIIVESKSLREKAEAEKEKVRNAAD